MKKTIGIIGSKGHGKATLLKAIEMRKPHVVGDIPDIAIGNGVDGCVLVVSAIDGPMPETREAILIARQFGIPSIIAFISHCDLVDDVRLIDLEETEIRELLSKHHLDGAQAIVIRGSSKAALESEKDAEKPIDDLIKAIKDIGQAPGDPNKQQSFKVRAKVKFLLPEDGGTDKVIPDRQEVIVISRDQCCDGVIELPLERRPAYPGDGVDLDFLSSQCFSGYEGMGFVLSFPGVDKVVAAGRVTKLL